MKQWNPLVGCTPVSSVCSNCRAAKTVSSHSYKYWVGYNGWIATQGKWGPELAMLHQRLDQPLHWRNSRNVRVSTLGDIFGDKVPNSYIATIYGVMAETPQHTYWVLTQNLLRAETWYEFAHRHDALKYINQYAVELGAIKSTQGKLGFDWPLPNVRIGTVVDSQQMLDRRYAELMKIPAEYRYLLIQLNEPIDIHSYATGISGIILRPFLFTPDSWIENLTAQCAEIEIPLINRRTHG